MCSHRTGAVDCSLWQGRITQLSVAQMLSHPCSSSEEPWKEETVQVELGIPFTTCRWIFSLIACESTGVAGRRHPRDVSKVETDMGTEAGQ